MNQFKMFFDIDKEEKWLNEKLLQGFRCTNINSIGMYTFKKANEDYVVRLDYQPWVSKGKYEEYQAIYEDFGWELIKGSRFGTIQYWQKLDDGNNEIFSDRQSKLQYYKRKVSYTLSFTLTLLVICYILYKDTSLYLTEGLWQMEGRLFWLAFLFETPFALFRSIPIILLVLFGISFVRAYQNYVSLKKRNV